MSSRTITLVAVGDDRRYVVEVLDDGPQQQARIEQQLYQVSDDGGGVMRIASERSTIAWTVTVGDLRWVFIDGRVYELAEARPPAHARSTHHGALTAPMPATVLRVLVKVGDVVKHGDSLVLLEAMKMELPVRANGPGTIRAVNCREGELVQPGTTLIEIGEA